MSLIISVTTTFFLCLTSNEPGAIRSTLQQLIYQ